MSLPGYSTEETALAKSKIVLPEQGRSVTAGQAVYTFKVTGENSYGKFGLFEIRMNSGYGIKPHSHKELLEIFFVVEGKVTFLMGNEQVCLERGSIATIPKKNKHAFANPSGSQAIMHLMFCPAAKREHYFEGLAEMAKQASTPDPETLRRYWEANDQYPEEDTSWLY